MKRVKGFLAGLVVGISTALYSIWRWEKTSKKKFSSVADKYYKQAQKQIDQLVEEYGPLAEDKLRELQNKFSKQLSKVKNLSEKDIKNIKIKIDKYIKSISKQVKNKMQSRKSHK